jgi:hypothetical protein
MAWPTRTPKTTSARPRSSSSPCAANVRATSAAQPGPAGPARVPQRVDRLCSSPPHGRRGAGRCLGPRQRRHAGHGARLRGRLQPLPAGPGRHPARGLQGPALGAADDHGALLPPGRVVASVQAGIGALADAMLAAQPPKATAQACRPPHCRWPMPCRRCAKRAWWIRRWAPTPGPSARPTRPTARACCWATRTSHGPVSTASGRCTSPCPAAGRDGRGHRPQPGGADRLQQGRGLVAHRVHRQALHAARTEARRGGPHQLPVVDGQPEKMRSRTVQIAVRGGDGQPHAEAADTVDHALGPGGRDATRRPELDRPAVAYALQDANAAMRAPPTPGWQLPRPPARRTCARPGQPGHALGQHHRGGPPGQRDVRRRQRGARRRRGPAGPLRAQPAGRCPARAGRPDRAGRQQERLRLEARPPRRCPA